jgi:hypothetical protein
MGKAARLFDKREAEFGAEAMVTRYQPGGMAVSPFKVNWNRPSCAISERIGFPLAPRSGSGLNTTSPPESGCPWKVMRPRTVALPVGETRLHPVVKAIETITRPIVVPEINNRFIVAMELHRFQFLRYSSTFCGLPLHSFVEMPAKTGSELFAIVA